MKTKEELVNTYIKYSSDITEEIFNKIIDKLENLGFKKYSDGSRDLEYKYFVVKNFSYLKIDGKYWFIGSFEVDYKEIQVSDILGEESKFEVGKWYEIISTNYEPGEHISKFLKLKDGNFYYSEVIRFGDYSKHSDYHGHANWVREVSLEEIQQYLPDKIIKEFVLPEKWCIKSTKDTIKVINDFIKSKGYEHSLVYDIYYIHYPFLNEKYSAYTSIQDGYTEITFDQFKQHVLKESVEEAKTIEKWSVGSYVVALENRTLSKSILKGDIRKINKPDIDNNKIFGELIVNSWQEYIILPKWKWFPTLTEAEAFSKSLLEPKPLTVDDLIEGEIYSGVIISGGVIIFIPNECELFNNYDDIPNSFKKNNTPKNVKNIKLATPEEKQWLNVCISENKYIEKDYALRGYDIYGKALRSEVTKPVNKPFEFNKWYKSNNADGLFFIQSKNTGYGFRSNHVNYWFTNNEDFGWNIDGLEPATIEEVKERLLSYAKEKYPIGTKFKCITYDKEFTVTNPNYMDNAIGFNSNGDSTIWIGVKEQCSGRIFGDKGKWAKVISKPETKVKVQLINVPRI